MANRSGIGRSGIGRGLVALGVLAAVSSTAHADRRTGLAGNLLIEDKDDVYAFPHLTSTYRNLISLDYGGNQGSGNALLTLGNADMAYGVALHRGDVLSPTVHARNTEIGYLENPPSLFVDPAGGPFSIAQAPATIVDFLLATGSIGFRASIGRGLQSTLDMDGEATSSENTYLMGEFGWGNGGVRGESTRIDLGASLLADFASTKVAGDDGLSGFNIGVNGLVRAYLPQDEQLDLGIIGVLGVNSTSVSQDEPEDGRSQLGLGAGIGVGPAFRFGAAQVAAYATLRFTYLSVDPSTDPDNDEDGIGTFGIVIPGVNMATEIPLNDWFVVRTGAQYEWNLSDTSGPGDFGGGTQAGSFGWNAGLGVIIDQFRFDGALADSFLLSGPNFIGGGTGFLAIASLTYSFDAARSGEVTPTGEPEATEPEAEEPPPPALQPAPPPGDVPPPAPAPAAADNPEAGATGTVGGGSAGGSISIGGGTN